MSVMDAQQPLLSQGLEEMGLSLDEQTQQNLLRFAEEMLQWNRRIKITAITDPRQIVIQHLLDSLSVLPFIQAPHVLDVGSGGGLPGLVLSIARPDLKVTSVDSRHKKIAFQRQAARRLGLDNFQASAERIENLSFEAGFEQIISRAFASMADFIALAGRHLAVGGQMLAMKGKLPAAEQSEMPSDWQVVKMVRLRVPEMQAERHLAVLEQHGDSFARPDSGA